MLKSSFHDLYLREDFQQWLMVHGDREQVLTWLVWNDRNGCYTDEERIEEGFEPLTLETARSLMYSSLT